MSGSMDREDWNRRYAAAAELVWTANPNRFLVAEVGELEPGRALDLAAGEGRNAVWLAETGWTVTAIDFSDLAIGKARQLAAARHAASRIAFEVADLRTCTFPQESFELVALIYLQIPPIELTPILERAARAVAPGGTFLLIGHDPSNLAHGHGGPQDPHLLYSAEQVVAALGDTLAIEKAGTVERRVETEQGVRVAIDCLVRARRP